MTPRLNTLRRPMLRTSLIIKTEQAHLRVPRDEASAMKRWFYLLGVAIWLVSMSSLGRIQAQQAVVHAVLFYSPTCPHCHVVIAEVLPPLVEQYGAQLQIVAIDITNPGGQALYQQAIEQFRISSERLGVPTLIVGTTVLVGSAEIPEQFPGVIQRSLAQGGANWPEIPGLAAALAASKMNVEQTSAPTADAAASTISQTNIQTPLLASELDGQPKTNSTSPGTAATLADIPPNESMVSKWSRDPAGNTVAVLLLIGMAAVFVYAIVRIARVLAHGSTAFAPSQLEGWRSWAVAALGLIGLAVSLYMAFVETAHAAAVCGPIGDCNTVQQSEYALLFGWLPIGVLGILGYAAVLVAWAGMRWGGANLRRVAGSALLGLAVFGAMFSMYLTFLEPFVIGATCVWCLTSALCMTLILVTLAGSMPKWAPPAGQMA